MTASAPHRSFALVLSGGGARGFAHIGVLSVLERWGYRPAAVVAVSMGAVVGVTWACRPDWYRALLAMDTTAFPGPIHHQEGAGTGGLVGRARRALRYARTAEHMLLSWGPGELALRDGRDALEELMGATRLEELDIPVAICATDLVSGDREVLRTGRATEAVYASAALAGVLPPLDRGGRLLVDGAYSDVAPVDVARAMDVSAIVAVDPGQLMPHPDIGNGFQAVMRAMEICHRKHADLRFEEADLVIRPRFRRPVDTLEFEAQRECVAAGVRGARSSEEELRALLGEPGEALRGGMRQSSRRRDAPLFAARSG